VGQKLFPNRDWLETHHNRGRFIAENAIIRSYVPGEEDPVVLDVVSDVGGRAATIGVDPLC